MANTNTNTNIPYADIPLPEDSDTDDMSDFPMIFPMMDDSDMDDSDTDVPMLDHEASAQAVPGPESVVNRPIFDMFPPRPPTRHFFSLPTELQLKCLECLCPHCREAIAPHKLSFCTDDLAWEWRVALCRFSRTSRHARDLAQPILFHRLQVGWTSKAGYILNSPLGTLLKLVRTLVMRPDLAAKVRTIFLNMDMTEYEMPLTKYERAMIMEEGDRIEMPIAGSLHMAPSAWIDAPATDYPEAVTTAHNSAGWAVSREYASSLLIALASNATSLDILNVWRLDHEFKNLMLWGNTGLITGKKLKIRRLRIEGETQDSRSLAEVAPFFGMAPITQLVVAHPDYFRRHEDQFATALPVDLFAPLKRLDLFDVALTAADFQAAMKCCPNLEKLSYLAWKPVWRELAINPNFVPSAFPPTPSEICHILSTSSARHTLRSLMLEVPRELEAQHSPGTIGSLQALTKLEYLIIGGNALVGSYKDDADPDWTPAHNPRLFTKLPVGLGNLVVFNNRYRDDGDLSFPDIEELVQELRDDMEDDRRNTGVLRPLVISHVDLKDWITRFRFNQAMPSWQWRDLSEDERSRLSWAKTFYSH